MPDDPIPDYEPMLASYHRAFAAELRAMIDSLPLAQGDRVLDMACGDGFYSPWLADRVGPAGEVVAVDVSPAYLGLAREEAARRSGDTSAIRHVVAPIENLPFDDDTFDLAWCAQSLYSLPDPLRALRQLQRVVRPGGSVAVLEDDELHHVLLPWPVELELRARQLEWRALNERTEGPRRYYIGRRLVGLFRKVGLEDVRVQTWASDRRAPLGIDDRAFLGEYLKDLRATLRPLLDPTDSLHELLDPDAPRFLLNDPDLAVTCIDRVVRGIKPGH